MHLRAGLAGKGRSSAPLGVTASLLCAVLLVVGCGGKGGDEPGEQTPPLQLSEIRRDVQGANVVICVIDAARPDHMGCYGYERDTTPTIDRIAKQSIVFDKHFCQATFTGVSTPSLFTGQYKHTHRVSKECHLPESAFTMARGLADAGFRTVLLGSIVMVAPKGPYGIGADFQETYTFAELGDILKEGEERHFSTEPVLRTLKSWLAENGQERFFAYIHLTPPHVPYHAPERFLALYRNLSPPGYDPADYHPGEYVFPIERENPKTPPMPKWINLYDANLRYADWSVGEVLRLLDEEGILDRTLVIVTTDHGEAFGEHGFVYHGAPPYEEVTHIPLVMRFPTLDAGGRRISALSGTIDVLPTLFDILDLSYPKDVVQGTSLVPLIDGTADEVRDYVFTYAAEAKYVVRSQDYSLILWEKNRWRELYDLNNDPRQRQNIIDARPDVVARMVDAFREHAAHQAQPPLAYVKHTSEVAPAPEPEEEDYRGLPEDVKRDLRALGYLK